MSEVDDTIAAARASWARITDGAPASRRRKHTGRSPATAKTRLALIGAANAMLLVAAVIVGLNAPIGLFGALLVLFLMVAVTIAIAVAPGTSRAPPRPETLREVDVKALPAKTERWLQAQRPALPPPAQHLLDCIGERLDVLSPQLGRLEPEGAEALEVRRLVGEQLPAFVSDYQRVPEPLRTSARNGRTPDQGLVDGLALVEREIAQMTERLAQGDLDSLQTRGRFLEIKYGEQR